jgi:cytoskeletal protein CcmA (bactofilin family)
MANLVIKNKTTNGATSITFNNGNNPVKISKNNGSLNLNLNAPLTITPNSGRSALSLISQGDQVCDLKFGNTNAGGEVWSLNARNASDVNDFTLYSYKGGGYVFRAKKDTGLFIIEKGLIVNGDSSLLNLNVGGYATLSSLYVSGNSNLSGNLTVNRDFSVTGNIITNGALSVSDEALLENKLTVTGETLLKNKLTIKGETLLEDDLTIKGYAKTIELLGTDSEFNIKGKNSSFTLDSEEAQTNLFLKNNEQMYQLAVAKSNYSNPKCFMIRTE